MPLTIFALNQYFCHWNLCGFYQCAPRLLTTSFSENFFVLEFSVWFFIDRSACNNVLWVNEHLIHLLDVQFLPIWPGFRHLCICLIALPRCILIGTTTSRTHSIKRVNENRCLNQMYLPLLVLMTLFSLMQENYVEFC